mmetsp:Transcript_76188/g.227079  ORF Transcript_76188/g.227079 Transcript_76188/m.227079 type:complete len:269 (+) Transcript_76188:11-817(+)
MLGVASLRVHASASRARGGVADAARPNGSLDLPDDVRGTHFRPALHIVAPNPQWPRRECLDRLGEHLEQVLDLPLQGPLRERIIQLNPSLEGSLRPRERPDRGFVERPAPSDKPEELHDVAHAAARVQAPHVEDQEAPVLLHILAAPAAGHAHGGHVEQVARPPQQALAGLQPREDAPGQRLPPIQPPHVWPWQAVHVTEQIEVVRLRLALEDRVQRLLRAADVAQLGQPIPKLGLVLLPNKRHCSARPSVSKDLREGVCKTQGYARL